MKYSVILKYHQSENSGTWGFAPIDTINSDVSFDPFWDASGIFHDVFEHWFEYKLKYFSGKAGMTLWGEMVASGVALAYRNLGINSFRFRKGRTDRDYTADTIHYVKEAILEQASDRDILPYTEFDMTKETCLIPYQKIAYNSYDLDSTIGEYLYQIETYGREKEVNHKKIIWTPGIERAYKFGYKLGNKIIGKDSDAAYYLMEDFLFNWNEISKTDVEYLTICNSEHGLYGIKFDVATNPRLTVKIHLIENYTKNLYPIGELDSF